MILLALFFLAALNSCGMDAEYKLEVVLPDVPHHAAGFLPGMVFEVSFPGCERSMPLSCGLTAPPGSSVFITSDLPVLPVVACPLIEENMRLYPAGGIFPADYSDGKLFLSFENGFASEVLKQLVENGKDLGNFNIGRFEKVLAEKSEANPWVFSMEEICYALSYGIFNSNFIRAKPQHTLSLPLYGGGAPGRWLLSNLCDKRVFYPDEGSLVIEKLPEGNFLIISEKGSETVSLFAGSAGWQAWFNSGAGVLRGSW